MQAQARELEPPLTWLVGQSGLQQQSLIPCGKFYRKEKLPKSRRIELDSPRLE